MNSSSSIPTEPVPYVLKFFLRVDSREKTPSLYSFTISVEFLVVTGSPLHQAGRGRQGAKRPLECDSSSGKFSTRVNGESGVSNLEESQRTRLI